MLPRTVLSAVLAALPLLPLVSIPVAAQSSQCAEPGAVSIRAGLTQNDRVDLSASPAQFQGRGSDVTGEMLASRGGLCWIASARGGARTLRSSDVLVGHERLIEGDASLAALHLVAGEDSRISVSAGAEIRGSLALTTHTYSDAEGSTSR